MRRTVPLLLLWLGLMMGCSQSAPSMPYVRLNDLDPTLAAGSLGLTPHPVLRVGLSPMLSPRESLLRYGPLLNYLSNRLGRSLEVVLSQSQTEMIDQLRSGGVHLGLVGSFAYIRGEREFGLVALAVPVSQQEPMHRSLILVRRYSGLESFAHLKGHTFAYTDPVSVTGRVYPEALVLELRESVDRFFERTLFTYSDEKSIRALDQGLVDGAAVNDRMYHRAVQQDPDLSRRLLVVAESAPLGAPPVVVNPRLGLLLQQEIQEALVTMADDDEGREVLATIGLDRFVVPDPAWYEPIRQMVDQVGVGR